jgi:hypothetical protein
MNRGADVVPETREGELCGSDPAADRLVALDDEDRPSSLCDRDRSGEAVRPRADDDGV